MANKPDKLYRGIAIKAKAFSSVINKKGDIVPFTGPFIDSKGRTTVHDGNEYGVYMSTNKSMVYSAYSEPRGEHEMPFATDFEIGKSDPNVSFSIPGIGIIYEIDTSGLDVREPWISSELSGHYNNGFEGSEWIADSIPESNYKITQIRIGRDLLNPPLDLDFNSQENMERKVFDILTARKQSLLNLKDALQDKPLLAKGLTMNGVDMRYLRKLFAVDGIMNKKKEAFNFNNPNEMLDYLILDSYKKNGLTSHLKYLEGLRDIFKRNNINNADDLFKIMEEERNRVCQRRDDFLTTSYKAGVNDKNLERFNEKIKLLEESLNVIKEVNTIKKGR